jgi:hypothetical protein
LKPWNPAIKVREIGSGEISEMILGAVAIIAATVVAAACIYEVNVWYRKVRAAMTPKEREADDNDILNMW